MTAKVIQNPGVAELLRNRLRDHPRTRRTGELLSDLLYPTTTSILSFVPFSATLLNGVGSFKATADFILDTPFAHLQKQLSEQRIEIETMERELALLREECQNVRQLLEESQKAREEANTASDPDVESQLKEVLSRSAQLEDVVKNLQAQLEQSNAENPELKTGLQSRSLTDSTTSDPDAPSAATSEPAGSWVQLGMLTPKSLVAKELSSSAAQPTADDSKPDTVPEEPAQETSVEDAAQEMSENPPPAVNDSSISKVEEVKGYDLSTDGNNDETPRDESTKQLETTPDQSTPESKSSEGHDIPRQDSLTSDPMGSSHSSLEGSGSLKKKKHFDLHLVQDFFSGKGDDEHNVLHKRRRVFSTPSDPTLPSHLRSEAKEGTRKKKGSTGDLSGSATLPRRHSRFESFVIEPLERRASSVMKRGKELLRSDSSSSGTRERVDSEPAPVPLAAPSAL